MSGATITIRLSRNTKLFVKACTQLRHSSVYPFRTRTEDPEQLAEFTRTFSEKKNRGRLFFLPRLAGKVACPLIGFLSETVYRKYPESETWHFTPDCSQWPSEKFIALDVEPRVGQVCNECRAKKFEHGN